MKEVSHEHANRLPSVRGGLERVNQREGKKVTARGAPNAFKFPRRRQVKRSWRV